MTDKPTPEQIQRACGLINTEGRAAGDGSIWNPLDFDVFPSLKVLADTIAKLDAMQAERDKARTDLGEIDRIAAFNTGSPLGTHTARLDMILAIAAPYRVETDPLVAEIGRLAAKHSVELSCEDVRSIAAYFKPIGRAA